MDARIAGRRSLAMFPGQGSQRPGMAAELLARHPDVAGRVLAEADEVTGLPLSELCVTGTPDELRRTDVTQAVILATSVAVHEVMVAHGFEPAATAGHSLGEYAALVAAGVLAYETALRLVRRRGELMARVAVRTPGVMAAVVGLPSAQVIELCEGTSAEVANYNEPGQTVVSGRADGVEEVERRAGDAGAAKVARLEVGAPFHCSLMRGIEAEFGAELDRSAFTDPMIPVLSSVTGAPVPDGRTARYLLRRQLAGPVRWTDTVLTAMTLGCDALVEIGPGRVLTGFAKRIAPDVPAYGTGNAKSLSSLLGRPLERTAS